MFIQALILAVMIGYLLKGRLRNFEYVKIRGVYCIILPFLFQSIMNLLVRLGYIHASLITLIIDILLYVLLLYFTFINRKDPFILIMGFGFLLNGIVIIINGGVMPVSYQSYLMAGIPSHVIVRSIGLYKLIDETTRLWFLGDIFPLKFIIKYVFSIGDVFIALGLVLFTVNGMKKVKKIQ